MMFLTRLGFGSKAVITGDVTQIDLVPGARSGLVVARDLLQGVEGIAFVHFTERDVVQRPLVQDIIRAYESRPGRRGSGHEADHLRLSLNEGAAHCADRDHGAPSCLKKTCPKPSAGSMAWDAACAPGCPSL